MLDKIYNDYINKLESFIQRELYNSIYYANMANLAPTKVSRSILLDMSKDEKAHAELFNKLYKEIKGDAFCPIEIEEIEIDDYKQALITKLTDATMEYQQYGKEYLVAPNSTIRDLFFAAKTTQAQHAMRLPALLQEIG